MRLVAKETGVSETKSSDALLSCSVVAELVGVLGAAIDCNVIILEASPSPMVLRSGSVRALVPALVRCGDEQRTFGLHTPDCPDFLELIQWVSGLLSCSLATAGGDPYGVALCVDGQSVGRA